MHVTNIEKKLNSHTNSLTNEKVSDEAYNNTPQLTKYCNFF